MRGFDVTIVHGVSTSRTHIQARHHEEAISQACILLGIPYERMDSAEAGESNVLPIDASRRDRGPDTL